MSTIIIENADKQATSLFKKLAEVLDVTVHVKKDKEIKYNPELLKRVAEYEQGKVKPVHKSIDDLKKLLHD